MLFLKIYDEFYQSFYLVPADVYFPFFIPLFRNFGSNYAITHFYIQMQYIKYHSKGKEDFRDNKLQIYENSMP